MRKLMQLAVRGMMLAAGLGAGAGVQAAQASAAHHSAPAPAICSGTRKAPGVLMGSYPHGVRVKGLCEVNAGNVKVHGNLTVLPAGAILADYAVDDRVPGAPSSLEVSGSVLVEKGATAVLGCEPQEYNCVDDPEQKTSPTLVSSDRIGGSVRGTQALGIILHHDVVGGSISQVGGGGGSNCDASGIFNNLGQPDYSDYEDSTVRGSLSVHGLDSCWLGIARMDVGSSVSIVGDDLNDPDAVEVLANTISGNLTCSYDSGVWDSGDESEQLYPRVPEPNTVRGQRSGQCVLATPATEGGAPGPGAF